MGPDDYTIGWICAIQTEYVAAKEFLDEEHDSDYVSRNDNNTYTLGRIGKHHVAIAVLPHEEYGTDSAASVARDMVHSFPNIRLGLMVGVGGGAPSTEHDIRLGDIVVSSPADGRGGVLQYDFGKTIQEQSFQQTRFSNPPPRALRTALTGLMAHYEANGHQLDQMIDDVLVKKRRLRSKYRRPHPDSDTLYRAEIVHPSHRLLAGSASCIEVCGKDPARLIIREERKEDEDNPAIHYGLIASGNKLIKDALVRDILVKEQNVLCFEMEAAGLMNHFPCLVIRGICDYSDSHKHKEWQGYAAMVAAAYAKDLLSHVSTFRVSGERPIREMLAELEEQTRVGKDLSKVVQEHHRWQKEYYLNDEQRACHRVFKTSDYEGQKNINPLKVDGTCKWVLEHRQFCEWRDSSHNDLLWISADPGCGKSVFSKSLVEHELHNHRELTVCYFFFKDNETQDSLATALCALIHQLFTRQPQLIRHAIPAWQKSGDKLQGEVDELWRIFSNAGTDKEACNIICVLDALDECHEQDRDRLITLLSKLYMDKSPTAPEQHWLKFLVTSRPYEGIQSRFQDLTSQLPSIRLRGEYENDQIHREINLVIEEQVNILAKRFILPTSAKARLKAELLSMEHRTYLWLYLAIEGIKETFHKSPRPSEEEIQSLPLTVEDAYEQILERGARWNRDNVLKILQIIVGARRPLTVGEMAVALGVATSPELESELKLGIERKRLEQQLPQWCGLFVFINHSRIYLIHQTAKEFLVGSTAGIAASNHGWKHCLSSVGVERCMARICVGYLTRFELKKLKQWPAQLDKPSDKVRSVELLQETDDPDDTQAFWDYAAEHWPAHVQSVQGQKIFLPLNIVCELYNTDDERFQYWFQVFRDPFDQYEIPPQMTAIQLAAFNGHSDVLKILFQTENLDLNAQDQDGRTALFWASQLGHEKVVQMLLNKGAEVNTQGGYYINALYAASSRGHEKVVQMLLNKGAEADFQGGHFGNALQAASSGGHEKVVQMLLDKGAEVNAQGGDYKNALCAASSGGHEKVVQMLLDKGAEVNAQGGDYKNALCAASSGGHEKVVQMLLDKGAEVNAQGGDYGNALCAASSEGHEKVVQMLLDKGTEVNAQGGSALQAASSGGHEKVVQMLLDKGAEVNAQGGYYGNALCAASSRGHEKVVQMLLDKGANLNAQGGYYGNALQAASSRGHEKVVQVLLDKGAEVDAQGRHYKNALYAASLKGYEKVVQMLQEHQHLATLRIQTQKRAILADSGPVSPNGDCARKKTRMDMPAHGK